MSHDNIQIPPTRTVDLDLDSLIYHIFHLLKFIKKEIGHAHWVTAGLLVVPNILQVAHGNEWFDLLEEVNGLVEYLLYFIARSGLRKMMENKIREAIQLMVEASLMFFFQIDSSKFNRYSLRN